MRLSHPRPLIIGALTLVVLAGVFMLYVQPDFMVQMANQVWGCF
jgi:hypothetical protein